MSLELVALLIVGGPLALVGVLSAVLRKKPPGPRATACTIRELPGVKCGRVVGVVRLHDKTLTAPLTGRPCVFYRQGRSRWQYFRGTGLWSETEWLPGARAVEFLLEDETGAALLDLTDAELELPDVNLEDSPTSRGTRDVEQVVMAGQRLEVVGSAVEEMDPDALSHDSLRIPPPARIRIVAPPTAKLFVLDRGQDPGR